MEAMVHLSRIPLLVCAAAALLASCSSTPVDAAGNWSVNVTNGANGCMLANWTVGQMTAGIPLTITQSGTTITAEVGGTTGSAADLFLGSRRLTGSVDGNRLDARLVGRAGSMGGCAYTPVIDLTATVTGDTMMGNLIWSFDTNTNPDCAMYATCESIQAMNGSRPPTAP
ncbi:MAG: hypothetical protein OHK0013_05010 [Sandaracinaceae bacterium]